jgi:hypothetical protein
LRWIDAASKCEIAAGMLQWEQVINLEASWKSLPSGILQNWPDGSPLTLQTLASLAVSIIVSFLSFSRPEVSASSFSTTLPLVGFFLLLIVAPEKKIALGRKDTDRTHGMPRQVNYPRIETKLLQVLPVLKHHIRLKCFNGFLCTLTAGKSNIDFPYFYGRLMLFNYTHVDSSNQEPSKARVLALEQIFCSGSMA